MKIRDVDAPPTDEQPRKKKHVRFRDPESQRRKKRNWQKNSSLRVEWNKAMSSNDQSRLRSLEEPPHGLNKLGAGNVATLAKHGNTPRHRPPQNHEQKS
jgi:hypothetical protein